MRNLLTSRTAKTVFLTVVAVLSIEMIGLAAAYKLGALDPYLASGSEQNPTASETAETTEITQAASTTATAGQTETSATTATGAQGRTIAANPNGTTKATTKATATTTTKPVDNDTEWDDNWY